MTRYFRLGYVIPRLVLLVALFVLAEFGSGYALRWAVIDQGEAAFGARVEVDESAVSVLGARATLTGVRVADPRRPMENLVQADRVELDFESDSLLRRKAIAERGVVRGLRFGTPRETSGALDSDEAADAGGSAPPWLGEAATQAAKNAADRWIADLEEKLSAEANDFESVRLAEELARDWPARFDAIAAEARAVQADVDRLREIAVEARKNPLRHAEFLKEAPQRATALRQKLAGLHQQLDSLPRDVALDKERVDQARLRDEQRLRQRLQVDQLDPQSLTSSLLGERVTGSLRELVGWVRWTREMVPSAKPGRATIQRSRGVDVHFVGVRRRPDFLVRELDLAGAAQVGGRPVELSGVLTNWTTSPDLAGEPMRLSLATTGALPLEIRATIDRTAGTPVDELLVDCPAMDLPAGRLGDADRFALAMPASSASLTISLRVEGDRLSGDVQLVQDRVTLATEVGPAASPLVRRIGERVADRVATVAKPATRVTLSGTLDEPQMAIWSTLGPAIAESLENAARDVAQREAEDRLAGLQQRIAGELESLDQMAASATRRLAQEIDAPEQEVERLASRWIGDELGRGTFSFEQLGKRLPTGASLFK